MRKEDKKRLALASGWMGGLCACLLLLAACGGSSAPSSATLLKTAAGQIQRHTIHALCHAGGSFGYGLWSGRRRAKSGW